MINFRLYCSHLCTKWSSSHQVTKSPSHLHLVWRWLCNNFQFMIVLRHIKRSRIRIKATSWKTRDRSKTKCWNGKFSTLLQSHLQTKWFFFFEDVAFIRILLRFILFKVVTWSWIRRILEVFVKEPGLMKVRCLKPSSTKTALMWNVILIELRTVES